MKFINNIQHRLLLKYPIIWSSRIVPVIIFAGIINVILFAFFYLISSPYSDMSKSIAWIPFLVLSGIIAVIIYLIYLLRFNKFKIFGKLKWTDFAFQFMLYFIALGSIVSWPFMPQLASHVAVNGNFTESEMREDLKEAYILANQLEYKESTAPYRKIKILVKDSLEYEENDRVNNIRMVPDTTYLDNGNYVKVDKVSENEYVGLERISLVCYSVPYNLIFDSEAFNDEIYESLGKDEISDDEKRKKLGAIFDKYIPGNDGEIIRKTYSETDGFYDTGEYENSEACKKYKLSDMGSNMNAISSNMIQDSDWEVLVRAWFYITLFISTLLVIFRYMSIRTFLWTFLFTFLLFVFSIIVSISMDFQSEGILGMMFFYYLLFFGFTITIFFSKSRNVFQGIALNLSFFCLFFVPMVMCALYIELDGYYSNKEDIFKASEIAGLVLVVVSSLFFHSRLFYKWYSLPEE